MRKGFVHCLGAATLLAMVGAALLPASASAENYQRLAVIHNDRNSDVHTMALVVDRRGGVDALYVQTRHGDGKPPVVTSRTFDLSEVSSPAGVVLDGDAEHRAIILRGDIDSGPGEGTLTVSYLKNGLFGSYAECRVNLVRHRGKWQLANAYTGAPVRNVSIETWALGISTISGICP